VCLSAERIGAGDGCLIGDANREVRMTASRVVIRSDPMINWIGSKVVDVYGARLGRAVAFVADREQPEREWVLIEAGRFKKSHKLVPFKHAIVGGHEIWVPVDRDRVMSSPDVDPTPSHLTLELFDGLEAHYADVGETHSP
jgi:hypothetical protein